MIIKSRVWLLAIALVFVATCCKAAETPWNIIPASQWKGQTEAQITALKLQAAASVALPIKDAKPLVITTRETQNPGLYEIRITLRPSHTADAVAFNSGLRIKNNQALMAEIPGTFFARVHEPETRTIEYLHTQTGPIEFRIESFADATWFEKLTTTSELKKNKPRIAGNLAQESDANTGLDLDLTLTPEKAVYFIVDRVEFRPLSGSGRVTKITTNKIRYNPGEKLKGNVTLSDAGGKGGDGSVNLYLEHTFADRTKVQSIPVKLTPSPQMLSFEIQLPSDELGYAVIAEYVSSQGNDRSSASEYFTIAQNYNRVAMFGANPGGTRDSVMEEEPIRSALSASRADYFNAVEYPFWAEDDLLAMSPKNDFWFSGQANYHMNKQTIQRQIRLAHEQGIAMVTYGKWCISGPIGWETVYDFPGDFKAAYEHPIGCWAGVNAHVFDLRRNGEQVPYSPRPSGSGRWFDVWWNDFIGLTPDNTTANVRRAAQECMRSIEMFGWDGIRWDDHPRGAGWAQIGRAGNYQPWAARQTQALVRYFKELVNAKYPAFGHGYNYLLVDPKKDHAWAVEDFELDELARGGGLLMNESIGNASSGWSYQSIVQNLQVDGDLCRERGGFYLGISGAITPRDMLIESALWAAAGCRPYNRAMTREVRRYCTRYAQYTFDENLRRIVHPGKILTPQKPTRLQWQPFVYETPISQNQRQIVVNLLNLPMEEKRPQRDAKVEYKWDMPAGTDPVTFTLQLPQGLHAMAVRLIEPQTLEVTSLNLKENQFEIPPVASWNVAVIDVAMDAGARSLAELDGPPRTLGMKRDNAPDSDRRPEVKLQIDQQDHALQNALSMLSPQWEIKAAKEQAVIDALPIPERTAALLTRRAAQSPEALLSQWWKGGALSDDLSLKNKAISFGDLSVQRNGRMDIFYARGAMDDRLRLPCVFAGLEKFSFHDAPLWGGFHGGANSMGLENNIPWSDYPQYDLLLLTGIPHCAIGAENCYGMVEYVKSGGAVFFTGGEYAFGKGGYMFTVLERDLLPVLCTEMKDTRLCAQPEELKPGKDFDELQSQCNFKAKPSFWVYNQVVLKDDPNIKVFLTSSKGPILVGWQVGKGRVACWLADHRGKSEKETTAFYDWDQWPGLMRALFNWLAPQANLVIPTKPAITTGEVKKIIEQFEQDAMGDLASDSLPSKNKQVKNNLETDRERVATIRRVLSASPDAVDLSLLLDQLLLVSNLPDDLRWQLIDRVMSKPPAALNERIKAKRHSSDIAIELTVLQCLGAVDPSALLQEIGDATKRSENDSIARMIALSLSIPWVKTPELVAEGKRRVEQWDQSEKATLDAWTGGKDFSPAAPELPGLDADALFQRIAWLAYLSRHAPETYAAPFARQWLMIETYQDYCARSIKNKKNGDWNRLGTSFGRLRDITHADLIALIQSHPKQMADGFSKAHFTLEIQSLMNALGEQSPSSTRVILSRLTTAAHPDIVNFARERLLCIEPNRHP